MLGGVTGPAAPPNVHSSQTRAPRDDLAVLRNRTFTELTVGESAGLERTLTPQDIQLFAIESGDVNPAHLDPEFAASTRFHGVVAHGMWGAALISAVLGTRLPGPGTIYLGQTLNFRAPVRIGDTLEVRVTVREKDEQTHRVRLHCTATRQDGTAVIDGEALVLAPTERIELPRTTLPQVRLEPDGEHGVQKLLARDPEVVGRDPSGRTANRRAGVWPSNAFIRPCDAKVHPGGERSKSPPGLLLRTASTVPRSVRTHLIPPHGSGASSSTYNDCPLREGTPGRVRFVWITRYLQTVAHDID